MKLDGIKLLKHIEEKRKELKSYGEIDMSSSLLSLQRLIETGTFIYTESLLSNSQVAERLGITRQNMPNKRKTKGFPEPVLVVDKFPMWLESDIEQYVEEREAKSNKGAVEE